MAAQHSEKGDLKKYWHVRTELTVAQNLLLFRQRIVVSESLRQETLSKIHSGHQGILRCRLLVSNSVLWPGVSGEVEKHVQSCSECLKVKIPRQTPRKSMGEGGIRSIRVQEFNLYFGG